MHDDDDGGGGDVVSDAGGADDGEGGGSDADSVSSFFENLTVMLCARSHVATCLPVIWLSWGQQTEVEDKLISFLCFVAKKGLSSYAFCQKAAH